MSAYYNEIDPYAAQWLRNLIDAGHIAPGIVDERSIEDVDPEYLKQFTQCHFFAGIGVWSYALRQAGWPDDRPVWTGSCPCQPFSAAGKGAGFDDERHLWPAFQHLIRECKPSVVIGEQVASKDAEPWIDLVHTDMEALGYAFGAIPFPSASVGAPHIRDRTYWCGTLADTNDAGLEGHRRFVAVNGEAGREAPQRHEGQGCVYGGVGDADSFGRQQRKVQSGIDGEGVASCRGKPLEFGKASSNLHDEDSSRPGPTNGFWRDADWLGCRDGKWRPVEPGTFPLAHGAASRVGRLRAYGNAINAIQAQTFIECIK